MSEQAMLFEAGRQPKKNGTPVHGLLTAERRGWLLCESAPLGPGVEKEKALLPSSHSIPTGNSRSSEDSGGRPSDAGARSSAEVRAMEGLFEQAFFFAAQTKVTLI